MHPNPIFRQNTNANNLAFVRSRGFGTLCINGDNGPLLSHIPIVLSDDNAHADFHLMRSNPIARLNQSAMQVVLSVTGPDSFISPDWYNVEDQVPTWNYVAVHLRGLFIQRPIDDLRSHLDELSAAYENQLSPKSPWSTNKMSSQALEKMMRIILPFRLTIQEIHGTWKLGQNKTDIARQTTANHVKTDGIGQDFEELAGLMLNPPTP